MTVRYLVEVSGVPVCSFAGDLLTFATAAEARYVARRERARDDVRRDGILDGSIERALMGETTAITIVRQDMTTGKSRIVGRA